ncbi:MAG: extracellular solute-binding protein, partial [Eubacterium sp.]
KKFSKLLALTLSALMTAGTLFGCAPKTDGESSSTGNAGNKDYDFYIFNTKGESAAAMDAAAKAYGDETNLKVKVFSLGSGTNASDTLRAEMNSKNKPAIFSVMNTQELVEWEEGGFVVDLNTIEEEKFKTMHTAIPSHMRLTSGGEKSYGIPYNVEGYGYIVDTRMIADLFGADKKDAFLSDCKSASYDEFAKMVTILDEYIRKGTAGTVTVSGKSYPLVASKTGLAKKLTGVFSVAGSEKWTYGDHMINIAIDTIFDSSSAASKATAKDVDLLRNPFIAYAKALDLKTAHVAGTDGPLPRGPEMINSTTNGYDAAVQKFAENKAIFMKQGNWVYTNIEKANADIV